jgi:hypothetical protein
MALPLTSGEKSGLICLNTCKATGVPKEGCGKKAFEINEIENYSGTNECIFGGQAMYFVENPTISERREQKCRLPCLMLQNSL